MTTVSDALRDKDGWRDLAMNQRKRIAELELALVDLYNLCMAKGWGTSPMVREMLAARRALRNE